MSHIMYRLSRRMWSARYASLTQTRLPEPKPTHSNWTVVRVLLSGICGSDLQMVSGQDSLYLTPEATYPFVPGHELVGRVEQSVSGEREGTPIELAAGDRVAVWPVLGCVVRGRSELCPACAEGWDGLCQRR
ncbi:MAG: alcohol dehydrogenase catalytic domain-containing protein, partial [Planctomycetes bacterium]|nr:alcohol dehydrogenase catalytic domain-containing protein [Planctomycetota bacterium]